MPNEHEHVYGSHSDICNCGKFQPMPIELKILLLIFLLLRLWSMQ